MGDACSREQSEGDMIDPAKKKVSKLSDDDSALRKHMNSKDLPSHYPKEVNLNRFVNILFASDGGKLGDNDSWGRAVDKD